MTRFKGAANAGCSDQFTIVTAKRLSGQPFSILGVGLICALCLTAPALALADPLADNQASEDNKKFPVPTALEAVIKCQSVEDDDARLKCYDRSVVQFNDATAKGDIIVAQKETVDKARKEVFGLSLSENPIFGNKEDEGVRSIESTIASARLQRNGKWIITLETGAQWRQTSSKRPRRDPKPGQVVIIERGLLGSFNVQIDDKRVFKALRVR